MPRPSCTSSMSTEHLHLLGRTVRCYRSRSEESPPRLLEEMEDKC